MLLLSCLGIQGSVNDNHCSSSSTEAGVLVAITGHGPTPPVGGTYYHWWRDPSSIITIPTRETRGRLLIRRPLTSEYSRCPPVGLILG
ncbi:hypothetical protein AVEN_29428-1 [Araneus ventricosus]|uniref:Uncharacterized protein n=1 Tax=Araneus ventricosus TaxID=182803 RepID=A0A4Y2D0E3_ARAVE|nr:hypothetical protein AVEN_29428-1 [Araneus ventricosus]